MLVIRMQRTGRKGHAMFRVVVQDSRRTPTSGKIVASLGSYDPHAKSVQINKDKAAFYLEHGAQPSPRVARLLKAEGVKLPEWVKLPTAKKGEVRNAEKRRGTAPPEEKPTQDGPAPEALATETAEETPAETATEVATSETDTTEETAAATEEPKATEEPETTPSDSEAPQEEN